MGQLLYTLITARHVLMVNLASGTVFPVGKAGGEEIPSLPW